MPKGLWALVNFVIPFAATFRKRPVVCGHTKVTMSALAKVKMSCFSNVADAERGWSRRGSLALNGLKIRRVSRGCCGRCYTTLASIAGGATYNSPPSCSTRARECRAGSLLLSVTARGSASLYAPLWSGPIQARVGHEHGFAIPVSREHLWPRGAGHFSFG